MISLQRIAHMFCDIPQKIMEFTQTAIYFWVAFIIFTFFWYFCSSAWVEDWWYYRVKAGQNEWYSFGKINSSSSQHLHIIIAFKQELESRLVHVTQLTQQLKDLLSHHAEDRSWPQIPKSPPSCLDIHRLHHRLNHLLRPLSPPIIALQMLRPPRQGLQQICLQSPPLPPKRLFKIEY